MHVRTSTGFTILEALITITIASILVAFAIPSFRELQERAARSSSQQLLLAALATARSTAVARGQTITFCGSANGITCESNSAKHFLVFHDINGNRQPETTEVLLNFSVDRKGELFKLIASADRPYLRFRPDGTLIEWGSITTCPNSRESRYGVHLILNNGGRARVGPDLDEDNIPETDEGTNINCAAL